MAPQLAPAGRPEAIRQAAAAPRPPAEQMDVAGERRGASAPAAAGVQAGEGGRSPLLGRGADPAPPGPALLRRPPAFEHTAEPAGDEARPARPEATLDWLTDKGTPPRSERGGHRSRPVQNNMGGTLGQSSAPMAREINQGAAQRLEHDGAEFEAAPSASRETLGPRSAPALKAQESPVPPQGAPPQGVPPQTPPAPPSVLPRSLVLPLQLRGPLRSQEGPARGASPPRLEEPRETPSAAPTIQISIGRVEVRAAPAPRPMPAPAPSRPTPSMSLDDYLNRSRGGR